VNSCAEKQTATIHGISYDNIGRSGSQLIL